MKSTRSVADQIFDIEGFRVRFVGRDGVDPLKRRVDEYHYERAARHGWTVARWRETRFTPTFADFDVEVLDGSGKAVHGKTLLSTVRASYGEIPDEPSTTPEEGAARRQPARRTTSTKKTISTTASAKSAEPLGFETTLWAAADKLRGSMDSSEYKHVVLGLIFLKYIDDAFAERRAQLAADLAADGFDKATIDELLESRDEYTAEGVFWVPPEARWQHLQASAKQPEIGKLVDNAMDLVEIDNPSLRGVLPKSFSRPALDQRRLAPIVHEMTGGG